MHRIKEWIEEARQQKHSKFDDLNKIVKRLVTRYGTMFPKYKRTQGGSKTVYHFNLPGIGPVSLEKEHGSREYLPPRYKSLALDTIEEIVAYVECRLPKELGNLPTEEDGDGQK